VRMETQNNKYMIICFIVGDETDILTYGVIDCFFLVTNRCLVHFNP